jgi:hypothetical protein
VEITVERLLLHHEIGGTDVGCPEERNEQDDWLIGFFSSDPYWELTDGRLTLTSGQTVREFETREAECRSLLVLPVHGREALLGTWQGVVVVDTNRENNTRTVVLSLLSG